MSDYGQPRSSVASLISMMNEPEKKKSHPPHKETFQSFKDDSTFYHGDDDEANSGEDEEAPVDKFDDLRYRA